MKSYCRNIDIIKTESFPKYDILYCDPPWEQRMVKYFQTIMKKQSGAVADNDINDILITLAQNSHANKPAFIEYSEKGTDRVIDKMEKFGHQHTKTVRLLQENGKPYNLIIFNVSIEISSQLKGFDVIREVIRHIKPNIVFDPFAGIGQTANAVLKCGCVYIGHEINPARYKRLKAVIDKHNN